MKKTRFAFFAAAALALVACVQEVQEEKPGTQTVGDNTLAFTIKSGIVTRSGDEAAVEAPVAGATFELGTAPSGEAIILEETVTSLDGIYPEFSSDAPETRGTPVYSENFKEMAGSFRGLAFPYQNFNYKVGDGTGTAPAITEGRFDPLYDQWVRKFDNDPWGEAEDLYFFARVLKDNPSIPIGQQTGVLTNSYQYSYSAEGGLKMSFSYRSAMTAAEQQDILFAARAINKAETNKGSDLLFYHALTGVKFATAHLNEDLVKTYIKKVEITGIYGYGKCYVTSKTEDGGYVDKTGQEEYYSSAAAVVWEFNKDSNPVTNSKKNLYSQVFNETPVSYAKGGDFGDKGKYADSFAAGGATNNLNDASASMTFWFPAQVLDEDAKMIITFEIESKDGSRKSYKREVSLAGYDWKAGQLRTFTLKSTEVDVEIDDLVEGSVKKNVVITNVGNAPAYIRAQIVGGWYGKSGSDEGVAMGFISSADDNFEYVQPWNDVLGEPAAGYVPYGTFSGLPGTDWVKGSDGYFYYTKVVMPGDPTGSALFNTYTLNTTPTVYYVANNSSRVAFENIHLVIDIPVQGVIAPEADDSTIEAPKYKDHKAAWAAAGVTAPDVSASVTP